MAVWPAGGQDQTTANVPPPSAADRKALTDAYTAARQALASKQYDVAIENFTNAAAIDARQIAVWSGLADAYVGAAQRDPSLYERAFEAFKRAIALKPNDVAYYNNYAIALAKGGKVDEARENLDRAVRLDPPGAAKYLYNLGAVLANSGQNDAAGAEFGKAIEADPGFADAQYRYGAFLAGKATFDQASGRIVALPGTIEALRKYLELREGGPNAALAGQLIAALGAVISPPEQTAAPETQAAAHRAIRVGGNVQAVGLLKQVRAVYPPAAKAARAQGTVRLQVMIGKNGTIEKLEFVSGPALLIQAAMDAVRQWEYRPALLDGAPVRVLTTVDVNFTLSQ